MSDYSSWETKVTQHFDVSSVAYGQAYGEESTVSHFFKRRQQTIMSLLKQLKRGKILDVGCGPGMMVEFCVREGYSYTGIDISPRMIELCRKKFIQLEAAEFLVGKLQALPFADASFDVLLCMGALEYVPIEEDGIAIKEMARIIKPGGVLIISFLNQNSPYWFWHQQIRSGYCRLKEVIKGQKVEEPPIRMFIERNRRQVLECNHFTVRDTIYVGFNVFLWPLDKFLSRAAVWSAERIEGLSRGPLRLLGTAFIIKAEKA